MSPGGQDHPWLRTAALEELLELAGLPFLHSAYQKQPLIFPLQLTEIKFTLFHFVP